MFSSNGEKIWAASNGMDFDIHSSHIWTSEETYLKQQAVDHDEVPHSQLPSADASRGEHHGRRERRAENEVLAKVQQRKARLRLERRCLILCPHVIKTGSPYTVRVLL